MPIEIKEITIKADVYPVRKNAAPPGADSLAVQDLERLKKQLTKEITEAVLQKIHHAIER